MSLTETASVDSKAESEPPLVLVQILVVLTLHRPQEPIDNMLQTTPD